MRYSVRAARAIVLICLLGLAMAVGGCVTIEWGTDDRLYDLTGKVVFGRWELDVDGALVKLYGPVQRETYSKYDGSFAFYNLPPGKYDLTVTTIVETVYGQVQVYVQRDTIAWVRLPFPAGYSERDFLDISGLRDLYANEYGQLLYEPAYNLRWRRGADVTFYFDTSYPAYASQWADAVWSYIHQWPSIYNYAVSTRRVYSNSAAKVEFAWVSPGTLGSWAGFMQVIQYDSHGYMAKVLVLVDERYGNTSVYPVVGHQVLHAVGARHVNDRNSIMFPLVTGSARNYLDSWEEKHLRLAFIVGPGQSVTEGTVGGSAMSGSAAKSSDGLLTTLTAPDGTTTVFAGVPEFVQDHPLVQAFLAEAEKGESMLWDELRQE